MTSNTVTFGPEGGVRVLAQLNGIKSRPYNGVARKTGTVIEAEHFDVGGQNVAYYSNVRYAFNDAGKTIYLLSSADYNHADEVRVGEMVKLKRKFSTTSPVTSTDYTKKSEYLKYTIDVEADNNYDLLLQMGAQNASNQLQIFQNDTLLTTATIPKLGTATEIKPYTISNIPLKKGVRVLTFKMLTDLMVFDNFKVQASLPLASKDVQNADKSITVYPNPATDMVTINFETVQSRTINIYNQFQKAVFSKKNYNRCLKHSNQRYWRGGCLFYSSRCRRA